jgi:hypothetical protein
MYYFEREREIIVSQLLLAKKKSLREELADHTTCWYVFCTKPQLSIFIAQNTNVSRNCCAKHKKVVNQFKHKLRL